MELLENENHKFALVIIIIALLVLNTKEASPGISGNFELGTAAKMLKVEKQLNRPFSSSGMFKLHTSVNLS